MATQVFWTGGGINLAQTDTLTVGGSPAAGNTITVTIGIAPNVVSLTYTVVTGDTTSTAASALQAILSGSSAPPQFAEWTWTVSANVITATAITPGTPGTIASSATGGTTCVHAVTQANVSQSDVGNAANWLRLGVQNLPQNGDDLILSDSIIPLLWNLDALKNVALNSITRFNSFAAQIGLPENNPGGYYEYRPTYFQFTTQSGNLCSVLLGLGPGTGPALERYNAGNVQVVWQVQPTNSAIRILNNNAQSTFLFNGVASVDIATLPAETSNVSGGITCVNGTILNLGSGVTFNGTLTVNSSSLAFCNCVPQTITTNGGIVTVNTSVPTAGTCVSLTAQNGAQVAWNSNTNVTQLFLRTNSILDKSQDSQPFTIALSTIDSTCQVNDPWNSITWKSASVINGPVTGGVISFGPGRSLQVV